MKSATLVKSDYSYLFNRSIVPFPELASNKIKPPAASNTRMTDNRNLFTKPELTREEKIQQHMDSFRKAERVVYVNFYTGGGAYKKGAMDAIYRGFNPMKPK